MIVGIISIFVFGKIFELNNTVLLVEVWGLSLFGVGWLVSGLYKTEASLN